MNASDLMARNVITVQNSANVAEAVRLMLIKGISGLPVVDAADSPVGMITEGDLLRRVELGTEQERPAWIEFLRGPGRQAADYVHTHSLRVNDIMSCELITVNEDTPAETVVSLMQKRQIKRIPVLRDGRIVGVVSRADLLRALLPTLSPCAAEGASDDDIRRCVEVALAGERWAPREGIQVSCDKGVVTLTGVIFEERERDAMRVVAERTPGVKSVRNELVWIEPISGWTVGAEDYVSP